MMRIKITLTIFWQIRGFDNHILHMLVLMYVWQKKEGSLSRCIYYRNINYKTIPEKQPILQVQDLFDSLVAQKQFLTLDMSNAYHQGSTLRKIVKHLQHFQASWALFKSIRIPYGLTNAQPCFQRYMNECLGWLQHLKCITYLEDTEN